MPRKKHGKNDHLYDDQLCVGSRKTENGNLDTAHCCDPRLAEAKFLYIEAGIPQDHQQTAEKSNMIAYHLRQSFKAGKITPEKANRLG